MALIQPSIGFTQIEMKTVSFLDISLSVTELSVAF